MEPRFDNRGNARIPDRERLRRGASMEPRFDNRGNGIPVREDGTVVV